MAIALDTSKTITTANGTGTYTCSGTNRIFFLGVVGDTSDTCSGATYDVGGTNQAMTLIAKELGAGDRVTYLFYLINPVTTSNAVVSQTGATFSRLKGVSYTGAKQSGQPDNFTSSNVGAVGSITETLTPVAVGCWSVIFGSQSNGTPSAGTGVTTRQFDNDSFLGDSNGIISGSTSMTVTRNSSAGSMSAEMASFAPVASAVNSGFFLLM